MMQGLARLSAELDQSFMTVYVVTRWQVPFVCIAPSFRWHETSHTQSPKYRHLKALLWSAPSWRWQLPKCADVPQILIAVSGRLMVMRPVQRSAWKEATP
jgi:hypothetical protein